jgi:hypothetical protein
MPHGALDEYASQRPDLHPSALGLHPAAVIVIRVIDISADRYAHLLSTAILCVGKNQEKASRIWPNL